MQDGAGRVSRSVEDRPRDPKGPVLRSVGGEPGPEAEAETLMAALLHDDPERASRVLRAIVARGSDRFVDVLLPSAARRLGEMWLTDEAGFAEVTVATARLQAALRGIEPRVERFDAPLVAVVVPPGETHTLGASVAAWRLRRAGASVRFLVDRTEAELVEEVSDGELASVCVSSSAGSGGTGLRRLIERLRAASGAPVVVGGAILDGCDVEAIRRNTGADHVAHTPEDAMGVLAEGAT